MFTFKEKYMLEDQLEIRQNEEFKFKMFLK